MTETVGNPFLLKNDKTRKNNGIKFFVLGSGVDVEQTDIEPNSVWLRLQSKGKREIVEWHDSTTPNNQWLNQLIKVLAESTDLDTFRKIVENNENELEVVENCSSYVLSKEYDRLQDLRQLEVEYRIQARANALLSILKSPPEQKQLLVKAIESIDKAIDGYQDISSIRGIVNSVIEKAVILAIQFAFSSKGCSDKTPVYENYLLAEKLAKASKHRNSMLKCYLSGSLIRMLLNEPTFIDGLTRRLIKRV